LLYGDPMMLGTVITLEPDAILICYIVLCHGQRRLGRCRLRARVNAI
jgi:hypothetical protein